MPSIAGLNPLFTDTIFFESGFWIGASPDRIAPAAAAGHLGGCALMVIHGAADTLVPVASAEAIYAAARGDKEIWIVPKADRVEAFATVPDEYSRRVTGFFDRYPSRRARRRRDSPVAIWNSHSNIISVAPPVVRFSSSGHGASRSTTSARIRYMSL